VSARAPGAATSLPLAPTASDHATLARQLACAVATAAALQERVEGQQCHAL